jgi:cytochrome c oxidase subunit 2
MGIERLARGTAVRLRNIVAAAAGLASTAAVRAGEYAGGGEAATKIHDPAAGWNHLWNEVIIDITVIGVIFALIMAWFLVKYRRRAGGPETGSAPRLSPAAAVAWVVIPVFVFLADDLFVAANGWALWNDYRDVPAARLEVQLESGMYSWDYTYANGVRVQNELRVPAGKPVMLRMTSRDSLHSHWIPDFRVKEDSMPGRVTYLWFYPEKPGEHVVTCAAYCGVMHSYMAGKIIVMPEAEFNAWLDQEAAKQGKAGKTA